MLTRLTIHNFALISELDVTFPPGFSVITGETGAGKSIILGALQLLMGARADSRAVLDAGRACRIEAEFNVDGAVRIITRTISQNGKSRAFIDDEPVTLSALKELSESLLDIHSQHQNLLLHTTEFQLSVVDAIAGNKAERAEYEGLYRQYMALSAQLADMRQQALQQEAERDFMQFQYDQLSEACIKEGEEQLLEEEIAALSHAGEVGELLDFSVNAIGEEERGILALLRQTAQSMRQAASLNSSLTNLSERVNGVYIDIKDLSCDIEDAASRTVIDPQRLSQAEERLDVLNSLFHKHRVSSAADLLSLQSDLEAKLAGIDSLQDSISELEHRVAECRLALTVAAQQLSATRLAALPRISAHLQDTLALLGMPDARIEIRHSQHDTPSAAGIDSIEFLVSANQGSPFSTLASLSGGEAARVMLAIKDMLTGAVRLPTIVFDEIDTGVSGRIAEAMGMIMQNMGNADRQVISITHLPQIAARGTSHYRVYKVSSDAGTQTHIERLGEEDRVREIAMMLSGEEITDAAVENARNLLK